MKTSPFIRIREKNKEIKSLNETLFKISSLLSCIPVEVDILQSIIDLQSLQGTLTTVVQENEDLKKSIGKQIADRVEKEMFSTKLENIKLKDKVDNLQNIVDTKDSKILTQKEVIKGNKKGFWDFIYKLFSLA